jgi:hypothetical protein
MLLWFLTYVKKQREQILMECIVETLFGKNNYSVLAADLVNDINKVMARPIKKVKPHETERFPLAARFVKSASTVSKTMYRCNADKFRYKIKSCNNED